MKIKHLLTTMVLTAMFLIAGKVGWGQVLLNENFNYGASAGNLTTLTTNWTLFSGTTQVGYSTSSLSMATYASTDIVGSATYNTANSEDISRSFTTQTSGSIYTSFLLNAANSNTSGTYFISLGNGTTYGPRLFCKQSATAGKLLFGISNSSTATYGTTEYDANTTYLVVIKYDFVAAGTTDDVVTLYVLSAPTNSTPVTYEATATGGGQAQLNSFIIRQASNCGTGIIDGIRIASTWAEAAGVDATAAVKTFNPLNGATGVIPTDNITISFDDYIRNTDNSVIDDANVEALLTLKETDAAGAVVAFTGTIDATKQIITINPDADLTGNQAYYVAIADVEDVNDNLTAGSNITFTTLDPSAPSISDVAVTEVAPYYAGDDITVTWTSANVDFVKIEAWVPSTSTWLALNASTDATDGSEVVTIPAEAYYSTAYKVRVSYVTTPTVNAESATFTIIATPSINDIQSQTTDGDLSVYDGQIVRTSGIVTFSGTGEYVIQDGNGSWNGIYIYDSAHDGESVEGDNITVQATVGKYNGITQLTTTTSLAVTSSGNPLPAITTLTTSEITEEYEGVLVKIVNAAVTNATVATGTFEINDGSGALNVDDNLYDAAEVGITNGRDLTITGIGYYNNAFQLLPRYAADMVSATDTVGSTVYTVDQVGLTITNIPFAADLATFEGNITPAANATFETYQADGTSVAADLATGYKVIVTAQDGITKSTYTLTINAASTDATVTSTEYTVNSTDNTITNIPYSETLAAFEGNITPAAGASFETYNSDGTTVATDLATGYKLICTAEDAFTTKTYTITLNTEPSHDANIEAFSVAGVDGTVTIGDHTVAVTVPYGTVLTNLVATFTLSSNATAEVATVPQVSETTENDFTAAVVYDVTAEDGATIVSWTVTVTVAPASTDATVISLEYTVNSTDNTITGIPYNEDLATFEANLTPATGATFETYQVNGTDVAADLATGYKVIVTAEDASTTKTYTITLMDPPTGELFFSEYIEGSSNNKALEIYNGTGYDVDLTPYSVKTFSGGATDATYTQALTGTLANGDVYVIANSSANASILAEGDVTSTVTYYNGDDAVGLYKDATLIDQIGVIGTDPGTNWAVAGTGATSEFTLIRKDAIVAGSTDWTASAGTDAATSEWVVYPQNYSALGAHKQALPSTDNNILTFTIPTQLGSTSIDDATHTVVVNMPTGTSLLALVPTITVSSDGSVSPASDVAQDFTTSKTYTVTAEGGNSQAWNASVVILNNDASLSDIKVDNNSIVGFVTTTYDYTVTLPYGSTVTPDVTVNTTDADANAVVTPATDITSATAANRTTTIAVTAEDGISTQNYTVLFNIEAASTDATLSALTVNSIDVLTLTDIVVADPANAGATMWFDNFTSVTGIVPTKNDATATIEVKLNDAVVADPATQALVDNDVVLVTVTAQDGTTKVYYKVTMQQKPIIIATAGTNGTITPAGSTVVDYDGSQAFDITASAGYHISALTVDAVSVPAALDLTTFTYTFNNVVADHTIDASFALTLYTVTFNVTSGGSALEGATVALTGYSSQVTDASGVATFTNVAPATIAYTITKTDYNTISSNVVVNGDETVPATMILATAPTYSVTFTVTEDGVTAMEGASVNLAGYGAQTTNASGIATFAGVGAENGIAYTVNKTGYVEATGTVDVINANVDVPVSITLQTLTITASTGANGTISPIGSVPVIYGASQDFEITATEGYHIESLLVDGVAVTEAVNLPDYSYSFSDVIINHTIAATFAINTYTITVTAGANGTTTPSTNQVVNHGSNLTFNVAADANYHISDVLVDGVSQGAIATYTFIDVTGNRTFETQFEIDSYTITANVSPVGAGTVTGAGVYNHGDEVSLVASPNAGYVFVEWQVNSTQVSTNATYTFTASEDVTAEAIFVEQATELFISEYIEGGSNNKAIEIFNPTASAVDLSQYSLKKGTNGADYSSTLALTGTLAAGDVYVVAHTSAVDSVKSVADYIDAAGTIVYFNGDDPIGLFKGDVLIDVIGVVTGTDPGDGWDVAGTTAATLNHTLVRKAGITAGTTDWTASAGTDADNSQWTVYPQDRFAFLGWHIESSEANILTFVLAEQTGDATIDATGNTVEIEVVSGTTLTALVPTITLSNMATISPASGVAQNFTAPVVYTVTAQDGTVETWTVTVTVAAGLSSEKDITTFSIPSQVSVDIDATAATVDVIMPIGTNFTSLTPTIGISAGASINPASGVAQDFSSAVEYTVTAQDASTKVWTVTVTEQQIPFVTIHDIQYTTATPAESPYKGQQIRTKGIITGMKFNETYSDYNFHIQDGVGAWNGVYVYASDYAVAVGDSVELVATVDEYNTLTELKTVTNLTVINSGNTAPAPASVSIIDAASEAYEGVLVKVTNAECTVAANTYGEWTISDGTNTILVDDLYFAATPTQGTFYNVTGIVDYSYSKFRIYPRSTDDVEVYTPVYTVTFNVTHNSTALEGATITITGESGTLTTDAGGVATIDLGDGAYTYTVTKTGYTDHNGSFTVAGAVKTVDVAMYLTSVETNTIANLKVFPNPFTNVIRFEGSDITHVTITSIIGQVIMDRNITTSNTVDTNDLVRGIYLVKFTNNKGESTLRKLIKE